MARLDELIDRWVRTLREVEPGLQPHLDEIADHVRTDAQVRVDAGAETSDAFAAAIGSFGVPRELAGEFLKSRQRHEERLARRLVVSYLAVTLAVTAVFVAIDKLMMPLSATWFVFAWVFVLNPLIMFPFIMRFAKARGGSWTTAFG